MGIQIPDFWGSLAGGYMQGSEIARQDEERKRQEAAQALQTLLSMQQSGAARAEDISAFAQANQKYLAPAIAQMQPQKLQPELRQDIANAPMGGQMIPMSATFGGPVMVPTTGRTRASSDQLRMAGLPTHEDEQATQLGIKSAQQQLAIGGQQQKLNQQSIDLGMEELGPQARAMRAVNRIQQLVQTAGPGYADKAINAVGGWQKLVGPGSSKLIPTVAENAFNAFKDESKIGNLDPIQQQYVRVAINTAIMDRQLQASNAQAALLQAQYRLSMGGRDPLDVWTDNVAKRLDQNQKDRAALQNMVGPFVGQPEAQVPEILRPQVAEYLKLMQEHVNLQTAQSRLAMGDLNIQQYLQPITPGQQGQQAQTPGPRNFTPEEFSQAKQQVETIPRNQREAFLHNKFRAGVISADDIRKLGYNPP